jgi:hypothetical protein
MPEPFEFVQQVVGGRLYLFKPTLESDIDKLEAAWAAGEAQRLPSPSYVWRYVRPSPGKPPIETQFRGFTPGHPSPRNLYRLPQSDRQEQLLRIQNAKSLFEERPQRLLGASGTVWVVDGQRVFVAERDAELSGAVAARLGEGELEPAPPAAPGIPTPLTTRFYRILPVGDTR